MVSEGELTCPDCGAQLKHYDTVRRIVRTKNRRTCRTYIRRLRCPVCHKIHRELPHFIFPFKQYEKEIIVGVLEGLITPETLGFEDYPCEATMKCWRNNPLSFYSRIDRT